jgi:APA family basic amino acid/polyamine antiporter
VATRTATPAHAAASDDLFQRSGTGLLRDWSVRDAFIYAALAINLVPLGLFVFSSAVALPGGSLIWAVALSGVFLLFEAIVYASLVTAMPRAGGDYVWISRILGGGIGFVLTVAAWCFVIWHWTPIFANVLNIEVIVPLATILGLDSIATFFSEPAPGSDGLFVSSMIVAVLSTVFVAVGMRTYARIQRFCFYGGLVGLLAMIVLLLVHSKTDFVSAFNSNASELYGTSGDAYGQTLAAGDAGAAAPGSFSFGPTMLLIPLLVFFNLWSNWGGTLYGEVRGASDFRKQLYAMGGALLATTAAAVILLVLFSKTFGWDFYYAANNAYWSGADNAATSAWPYPGLYAAFLLDSPVLQAALVGILSLFFFGWVGNLFLSSTRLVFATAFDRVLPEWVTRTSGNGVPYYALLLLVVPSIPISYLYAYDSDFATYTLDATLVFAVAFVGTAVAAAIFPWRRPDIYNASPVARFNVLGIPLITIAAVAFGGFLVFCVYEWISNDVYGVNNTTSFVYVGALYAAALVIYVGFRIYRRRQGIDIGMVYSQIPEE